MRTTWRSFHSIKMIMRQWTPTITYPSLTIDRPRESKRIFYLKLFLVALILIILLTICLLFYYQQADFNRQHQQIYKDYWKNQQSTKTLEKLLESLREESIDNVAQAKIVAAFNYLNMKEKTTLLLFLYQAKFFQNISLNLNGADLNGVQLTCPEEFQDFHLNNVDWKNGEFLSCYFTSSSFDRVRFSQTKFINCSFRQSSMTRSDFDRTHFLNSILIETNFIETSIVGADWSNGVRLQSINFSSVDLHRTKFNSRKDRLSDLFFSNVRFPNGSFQLASVEENLIGNGDAETECKSQSETNWKLTNSQGNFSRIFNRENSNNETLWGQCSFVLYGPAKVYQEIHFNIYSLLIDKQKIAVSFSAMATCESSFFYLNFYRSNGLLERILSIPYRRDSIELYRNASIVQYISDSIVLPAMTRVVRVEFESKTSATCYFDNIVLRMELN